MFDSGSQGPAFITDLAKPTNGNKIDAPIVLRSDLNVGNIPGGHLRLSSIIEEGGPRSLTMTGSGYLHLMRANAFTGRTIISNGLVSLDAPAGPSVSADVVIGDGTSVSNPFTALKVTGINQIPDQGRVEVIGGGILRLEVRRRLATWS